MNININNRNIISNTQYQEDSSSDEDLDARIARYTNIKGKHICDFSDSDSDSDNKRKQLYITNWENIIKPKDETINELVKDFPKSELTDNSLIKLIYGYIRQLNKTLLKNTRIPSDINGLIINYIPCLIATGDRTETDYFYSPDNCILPESIEKHIFGFVKIRNYCQLSPNSFDRGKDKGGKVIIKCLGDFIIDTNSSIDVTERGYEPGRTIGRPYNMFTHISMRKINVSKIKFNVSKTTLTGGSYNSGPIASDGINNDGGGGPGGDKYGGKVYGDKYLSVLHLGSGGSGCDRSGHVGGGGGGAIKIETYNLVNNGSILANGGSGNCCGSGSGGSIHIVTNRLVMDNESAKIEAIGGHSDGSVAGVGRIRIEMKDSNLVENMPDILQRINPTPYLG